MELGWHGLLKGKLRDKIHFGGDDRPRLEMCYMQLAWNATKGQSKNLFRDILSWKLWFSQLPVWWDMFSRSLEGIAIVTYHTNLPLFLGKNVVGSLELKGISVSGCFMPGTMWCRRCNKMLGVDEHHWFPLGGVPMVSTNLRVPLRNFRVDWQYFWTVIPGMEFSFGSNFRIKPCHISLHLGCFYFPGKLAACPQKWYLEDTPFLLKRSLSGENPHFQ